MSNYVFINPAAGFPAVTAVDSTPQLPLGYEQAARDVNAASSGGGGFGVFQYCRGSDVANPGQFVHIINGSAVQLAAANSASNFPVGVVVGKLSATNQYGWVQVQGRVDYASHTNTGVTAGVQQYICAGTVGLAVSNVVAGNRIQGLCVPFNQTQTATSVGYVYDLNRPFVAGLTASL